jgi:hypothetical protein
VAKQLLCLKNDETLPNFIKLKHPHGRESEGTTKEGQHPTQK